MSLRSQEIPPIPEETARVAHAACPQGTLAMHLHDHLGVIYDDATFAPLFASCGQPAEAPWRLALVTVLQFAAGLSDRQAAEAVRVRVDWKYVLALELTDPGFHYSVLCEFRTRLLAGGIEQVLLDALLQGCVKSQRTGTTEGATVGNTALELATFEVGHTALQRQTGHQVANCSLLIPLCAET